MDAAHLPGARLVSGLAALERARQAVAAVVDPEIPSLTIHDMGILRDVRMEGARVVVTITPTYSGCPALGAIRQDVEDALAAQGFPEVSVRTELSPAWSTDWLGEDALRKLEIAGIAAPRRETRCPSCRADTHRTLSEFGSTACKALLVCTVCGEPFERFKELS